MPQRDPLLKKRSRGLRREATPAERILWYHLRGRRFAEFKFRRQHVMGRYIVDFYCADASLVVELDGESHVGKQARDERRQARLEHHGLKVLRFWNPDIYEDLEGVLEAIWRECQVRRRR